MDAKPVTASNGPADGPADGSTSGSARGPTPGPLTAAKPNGPSQAKPGRAVDAWEPTDAALIAQLRGGDNAAGDALVRRYVEPLVRYLRRLAGSDHVAEELHQQTWLSVLEHLEKFDPSTSSGGFKAWLFRIATNKANDVWRSRGRDKVAKEGLKLVTELESPDAAHRMTGSEDQRKLLAAIEQLPENQRQVLLLRYYSELKFVEIAEMLGCPLNTALGRMHKAMLKLKQLMET
ncbi:ECF family RNA polymerase sigma factor SbrI [soil metagenome]